MDWLIGTLAVIGAMGAITLTVHVNLQRRGLGCYEPGQLPCPVCAVFPNRFNGRR